MALWGRSMEHCGKYFCVLKVNRNESQFKSCIMKHKLRLLLAVLMTYMMLPADAQVTDTSAWWAHMTGTVTDGVIFGVYGTQGTPHANNTPGSRGGGGGNIVDKSGNLWLFGGHGVGDATAGNSGLNDLWKYNVADNQWTWIGGAKNPFTPGSPFGVYGTQGQASAANWPGGRAHIVPCMDSAGNFWIFGGNNGFGENTAGYLSDLWKYDMTSGQWTWMHGTKLANQFGSYGIMGQPSGSNIPGARGQYMAWIDKEENFWLFGGYGYAESGAVGPLSDLWKYSIKDNQWTWVAGAKTTNQAGSYTGTVYPGARFALAGWRDAAGKLWLFGGVNSSSQRFSDLWRFDPATSQWTFVKGDNTSNQFGVYGSRGVPAAANKPGARYVMVSWTDGSGNFWMYGGYGYAASGAINYLNDIWRYSPADNTWTWMKGTNTAQVALGAVAGTKTVAAFANTPGYKQASTGWVDALGNFWIHGGANTQYNNSLWRLAPVLPPAPPLPGNFLVSKANVCKTETGVVYRINQVAGATSYEWTYTPATGVTITGSDTSVTLDFSASAANGTLSVVAKNTGGTSPSRDLAITVHDLPVVPAITGTTSVCVNGTTTLSNTASGGTWLTANSSIATVNSSTGVVTGVAAGTTNISYRVINAGNCTTTVSASVTVNAVPVVPAITGTTSVCVNGTTTLSNTTSGGTWLTANSSIATVNSSTGVVTGVAAGTTNISYRVINASNCTTTVSASVTVNAVPVVPVITGTTSVCVSGTTTLSNTASGGTWLSANTSIASVNSSGVVTGVAAGTTNISYRVINASNCTTTVSASVTVNALPVVPAITGTTSVCVNGTTTLSNTTAGGTWLTANSSIATVNSSTGVVTGVAAGTTNISYRVINASNCTTTVLASVTVNALPVVPAITGTTSVCVNGTTTLSNTASGGTWLSANSSIASVSGSGVVTGVSAGTTNISYRVINAGNCTTTVSASVTVNALPTVSVTPSGTQSICQGDSLLLTETSGSSVQYEWKRGTVTVGGNNATYYAAASGDYQVTVTNGICAATSALVSLTVNPLPVALVTAGGATEVCAGETVTLTAAVATGADYQWKDGATNVGTNTNAYIADATGSYKVVVTNSTTGCSDSTLPVEVIVYARPVVSLEPGDTAFCAGGLVTLEVESQDTGLTYRWKDGNATIPLASAYFLEITETGAYTVVVGRSAVPGCEDTTNEVTVMVHDLPVVDITWDDVMLHATTGHSSYQWNTGGQGIAGATDSTFEPLSNGGYSVTVTDDNGCSSTSPVYNITNVSVGALIAVAAQIQVYPNPAKDVLHINAPTPVGVVLSSMDGRLLLQQQDAEMVDISRYANGIYLLRIINKDGICIKAERVVKQSGQ